MAQKFILFYLLSLCFVGSLLAQVEQHPDKDGLAIYDLIKQYGEARANQDTAKLAELLTEDVDQHVSSGEWRTGLEETLAGMVRSSESNPGERSLNVQQIRFVNPETAVVDVKYDLRQANGQERNMWSTFVVVHVNFKWKIAAIRNMLPSD
jgi:uncharacterized protein (TIGR02246 family)